MVLIMRLFKTIHKLNPHLLNIHLDIILFIYSLFLSQVEEDNYRLAKLIHINRFECGFVISILANYKDPGTDESQYKLLFNKVCK